MHRGGVIIPQQRVQAHDDAGSTEAALATIALGHTFLSRMWPFRIANPFNSNDMLAV